MSAPGCITTLAGINFDPQQPGFRHILSRPHFVEGLDWVKSRIPFGQRPDSFRVEAGRRKVRLTVDVPVNTTGTVIVGDKEIPVSAGVHEFKF